MNNIVQKITSDSPEVKDVANVLQKVKATIQQRYPYTVVILKAEREGEPNLRSEKACASEIGPLPNVGFDNIRFQRGSDIVDKKNQIQEIDKFQYRVKSQSTCGEYEVFSTELGWVCSCADHKFRGVICKHLYAIFYILNREQEAEAEDYNQQVTE
jgi:SWIM zinc finger